jgi:LPXTG-motif cell wall-anchored protein
MRRVPHRLLAGTAAAFIAAASLALPGTPAVAAGSDPSVSLYFPDISVAGAAAKINPVYAWADGPGGADSEPVAVKKLTVTVDTSGVADLAAVKETGDLDLSDDQSCTTAGAKITCTIDGPLLFTGHDSLLPLLALQVTGKDGAAEGASGKLTLTAQADDGPVTTSTSTVTVGEGVDLAGFIDTKAVKVAPGATADTDLRVANVGAKTAHGVVLAMLGWDPSLLDGKGFSNCTYGLLTVCTFDDDLETATTYALSSPMKVRIPADAAAGSQASAIGSWYTPSDFQELLAGLPADALAQLLGPKGTGAAVHLEAQVKPKVQLKKLGQVDTKPDNNVLISEIEVSGGQQPDEAAVGATVSGAAGEKVAAKVGFVNNGPGTLYHWTFDNTDVATEVTVPAGLKVVKADDRCVSEPEAVQGDSAGDDVGASAAADLDLGDDDGADYYCLIEDGATKAKASALFDFTFEVRSASAAGSVAINQDEDVVDRSSGDNIAALKVELTGGGGLPVTGSNAAVIGGAGVLLAAAGVFGVVLFRRRRVRFTA